MNKLFTYLLAVALLLFSTISCNREDTPSTDDKGNAVLISTHKVVLSDLPIWLKSVGRVHSVAAPTLAAEIEGRITLVAVDAGEVIELGQLLAETDTSTLLLQRQAAQAGLERLVVHIANGKRRVERFEKLSSQNLSSQTQLDDAREQLDAFQADYKAAQAELAIVNDSIKKSRIIAPVSGVVQQRLIAAGDFVKRGQALFKITNPARLQAWLPYPETAALQIAIGQTVIVKSLLTKELLFQGEISELQPAIGPGSRALMTITDIDDPGDLRPEATITGRVLIETRRGAVMVPEISVVRRPGGDVVYAINGNRAKAHPVLTGQIEGDRVEILSGLEGNETIAADGAAFLTDGARVKISELTVESA